MSRPELLYGACGAAEMDAPATALAVSETEVIELNDVEIFYSLFELPMAASVARLPVSLHPSIPAVLGMSFWRVPVSPFGPFELAYVGLACRTGIKPRHLVTGAWCNNVEAAAYLRRHYGFDCRTADIRHRESYERVVGQVKLGDRLLLEVVATELVAIGGNGAAVKYSPPLNLTAVNGEPVLAQFEAGYAFKKVLRGVVQARVYDAASLGDGTIAPSYAIAGTHAVCDVQLLPVRFVVDLVTPAEDGGARKVTR